MEEEFEIIKRNSLIRFSEDISFKDLAPVFRALFEEFMLASEQHPGEEEEDFMEMLIRLNLKDLVKDRKPPGHNREARYRMIFPRNTERVEFYLYPRISEEESEIDMITDKISDFLNENGLEHEVIWDQMETLKKKID